MRLPKICRSNSAIIADDTRGAIAPNNSPVSIECIQSPRGDREKPSPLVRSDTMENAGLVARCYGVGK